jgi:hypothetical protein
MTSTNKHTLTGKSEIRIAILVLLICLPQLCSAQSLRAEPIAYFEVSRVYSKISVSTGGDIYLLSSVDCVVDRFDSKGKLLSTFGGKGSGSQFLNDPKSIWTQNDLKIFIADYGNSRITILTKELGFISTFNNFNNSYFTEEFRYPIFVSVMYNSDILILDSENRNFVRYNQQLLKLEKFGGIESGTNQLVSPVEVFAGKNELAVADAADSTLKFFNYYGSPTNKLNYSGNPVYDFGFGWFELKNNELSQLNKNLPPFLNLNDLIDDKVTDLALVGSKLYCVTPTKVVVLNVSTKN